MEAKTTTKTKGQQRQQRRFVRRGVKSLHASSWMHRRLAILIIGLIFVTTARTTYDGKKKNGNVFSFFADAYIILGPSSTPEQVIESQLSALQVQDMAGVFQFASPANRQNVNNDVEKFGHMVRSGPYKHLLGHERADIMLQSSLGLSKQYLVRVITDQTKMNDDDKEEEKKKKKKIVEYWWSLSRSTDGPNAGCYMVDAVIPNL